MYILCDNESHLYVARARARGQWVKWDIASHIHIFHIRVFVFIMCPADIRYGSSRCCGPSLDYELSRIVAGGPANPLPHYESARHTHGTAHGQTQLQLRPRRIAGAEGITIQLRIVQ